MQIVNKHKDVHDCKILVVDDASLNRELIFSYLEYAGFRHIEMAVDGQDALEKVEQVKPDLVVLDLIMPRMDGYEFIKHIRGTLETNNLPIIVQTSITEPEQRIEAWKAGANDVLSKPIHRLELLSRVNVQLNNLLLIRELEDYQQVAQQDINQALEVQRSILPPDDLIKRLIDKHNVDIKFLFSPSRFLSGDMWGILDVSDNELGIWICDFSGKGIRAALHTFRIHTLIQEFKSYSSDPTKMTEILNKQLSSLMSVGQFATFAYGILNFKENKFHYAAASAPHPIIYKPKEKSFLIGDGRGFPIGISCEQSYPIKTLDLNPGESLVLYSDLLWEEKAIPGISFLEEHLPSFGQELNGASIVSTVGRQIDLLGNQLFLFDDLTLVEVHLREST